jgi:CRP-like cAMP-binding protein
MNIQYVLKSSAGRIPDVFLRSMDSPLLVTDLMDSIRRRLKQSSTDRRLDGFSYEHI